MILDHRTYTFKPGQLAPFLKLYEPQALQIQISHLGNLVGYFISDIGPLNQAVHIWSYGPTRVGWNLPSWFIP